MRNILAFAISLITFSCVAFLLWRQRSRHLTHVLAKANGYWDDNQEKRRFKRFKVELPVDCTIAEKSGDTYSTFTKDISGQGICLRIPEIVPKESTLNLVVDIPNHRPIKIVGEVVWVKEIEEKTEGLARAFDAGIKFLKIDAHDKKLLDNFLIEAAR